MRASAHGLTVNVYGQIDARTHRRTDKSMMHSVFPLVQLQIQTKIQTDVEKVQLSRIH
jgi:hypothetical protein